MEAPGTGLFAPETLIDYSINLIGTAIDLSGVMIIVTGIVWATARFVRMRGEEQIYALYKIRIGRSLLLGLELLVAADIVKTIAVEPSFMSLGVLAGLVVVRTFLAWTLSLEVEGRWPWQARLSAESETAGASGAGGRATGAIRSISDSAINGR